jgi:hypothetical protein
MIQAYLVVSKPMLLLVDNTPRQNDFIKKSIETQHAVEPGKAKGRPDSGEQIKKKNFVSLVQDAKGQGTPTSMTTPSCTSLPKSLGKPSPELTDYLNAKRSQEKIDDGDALLLGVLWVTAAERSLFEKFPNVLKIDTTFGTNNEGMHGRYRKFPRSPCWQHRQPRVAHEEMRVTFMEDLTTDTLADYEDYIPDNESSRESRIGEDEPPNVYQNTEFIGDVLKEMKPRDWTRFYIQNLHGIK